MLSRYCRYMLIKAPLFSKSSMIYKDVGKLTIFSQKNLLCFTCNDIKLDKTVKHKSMRNVQ